MLERERVRWVFLPRDGLCCWFCCFHRGLRSFLEVIMRPRGQGCLGEKDNWILLHSKRSIALNEVSQSPKINFRFKVFDLGGVCWDGFDCRGESKILSWFYLLSQPSAWLLTDWSISISCSIFYSFGQISSGSPTLDRWQPSLHQ